MEIFLNLKGMQISLINNANLEIAVVSIKDSNSVWSLEPAASGEKNAETKIFSSEYSDWLENTFSEYLVKTTKTFRNEDLFEINFDSMTMVRPLKGYLKRSWEPGLLVQYRTSNSMMSLKCCVNRIQIDNQVILK